MLQLSGNTRRQSSSRSGVAFNVSDEDALVPVAFAAIVAGESCGFVVNVLNVISQCFIAGQLLGAD